MMAKFSISNQIIIQLNFQLISFLLNYGNADYNNCICKNKNLILNEGSISCSPILVYVVYHYMLNKDVRRANNVDVKFKVTCITTLFV